MGITIPVYVDATEMASATVKADLTTVRDFINMGVVTGDLSGTFPSRKTLSPEVTGSLGSGNSRGQCQDFAWASVLSDPLERSLQFYALTGADEWRPIPKLARSIYLSAGADIHVHASWYAWEREFAKVTAAVTIETILGGEFKLFYRFNQGTPSPRDHTVTGVYDSAHALQLTSRKQLSLVDYIKVNTAGWYDFWIGVNVQDNAEIDGINVEPRNFIVEVHYV